MHRSRLLPLLAMLFGASISGASHADDSGAAPESPGAVAKLAREALSGAGHNDAPRLVRNDAPVDAQPALAGQQGASIERGYRWWVSRGRADLGLGLGTLAYVSRAPAFAPGLAADRGPAMSAAGAVMTLGMRYRTSANSAVFADAAGVRGPGVDAGDGVVGKVGLEFKSAQSSLKLAYGGLGMRLAGDARMTVRVRRGGLGLAMQRAF